MSAKVAVIVTLCVVAVTFIFSYYHYREVRKVLLRDTEMQLLRIAEGLQTSLETSIQNKDLIALQHIVDDAAKGADIDLIVVYDPRGGVTACNKKKWTNKSMEAMRPAELTDNDVAVIRKAFGGGYSLSYDPVDMQYCMAMPISYGKAENGVLHINLNSGTLNSALRDVALESLVISVLLSLLLGTTIYFLFHYLFTGRIKSVLAAAFKLMSGDMTARAEEKGTDEIGYLATSFNALADEVTNWQNNLEEMAASRVKELSALYEVVDTISKSLELNQVLPNVLERILENLGAGKGVVVLVGNDGKTLNVIGHRGLSGEGVRQIAELGQGCAGEAILENHPVRIGGKTGEAAGSIPGLEQENVRSALVVPITARGEALGALAVYSESENRFSEQDEALMATIGSQVGVAVENARLYERTLELAQLDGLTNLANRRHLMERLKQEVDRASRYQTALSILMLDLDNFKKFNDTYGHLKGDELLRSFSAVVTSNLRTMDLAGRYGGEEFLVVMPNTSIAGAVTVAERIRKSFEGLTIAVGDGRPPAGTTVSSGVAEYAAGNTDEELISVTDAALYRAKEGGRNRVEH